ncbi:DNA topoisomerase I [Candidatus Pacearchaeota archaeon]|nr:DNA topoisomerase I [Candidatus Pacearchaeota archaeon]
MAVNDFLPLTDVKMTTEKEVRQKPSLAELTTIESPGKPMPADSLEGEKEKKKARKAKKETSEAKEEKVKKDGIMIITEKPQAAMKIAFALGDARKYTEEGASYYEVERNGKKIIVASAVGHLFNLTYVKGQKGWPIFNVEWEPSFESKAGAFTRRYYNLLKKLARTSKEFMVATDFDVEGEVIGWNVLRFICKEKTAKRMKYSTLTAPELEKAFENPMKELAWGNAYAGETRHVLDWMYGINLSRALMSSIKKAGSFKILSIGRVQGPALKIIVDRDHEIDNFKVEPFWRVFADAQGVSFQHPEDIFNKDDLKKFDGIKQGIAETRTKDEKTPPPVPFDLTTLQREAYRLYKMNPSETLKIAQKLYLDGIISYPRTSSQKIPDEIEPKKILKKLEKQFPEAKNATRSRPIEGKKSDPAHPSIYPTGEFRKLDEREEKIYKIIAKRFIAAFSPDALTVDKKITLTAGDVKFIANGLTITEKGWTAFYPVIMEEIHLPDMQGVIKIDEIKKDERETQPPKRYTPTSLVSILEKKNLGTKATRSMIVDTLFERGYLEGTSIKATPLGVRLVNTLNKYSPIIVDENLTRQLEEELEKIQLGGSNLEEKEKEVIEKAKRLITDISKEFKVQELNIGQELSKGIADVREQQKEASIIMPCPTCKQGNLRIMFSKKTRRYFAACSNYPNCKQTYTLPPNALIKKTEKVSDKGLPILIAIRKGKRPWEFPFDPFWKKEATN